jgi:catechol 2,3-dioxygenase-like lactoylglutathione lyase family enzyme
LIRFNGLFSIDDLIDDLGITMRGHHFSIRTADIHRAIAFYETLGFRVNERFTTGYTLACWMEGPAGRLELIQIPEPSPAVDAFGNEHYVGYYHLSLDLTDELTEQSLEDWLNGWRSQLMERSLPFTVLLLPQIQNIGEICYRATFVADPDGLPLELLQNLGPT